MEGWTQQSDLTCLQCPKSMGKQLLDNILVIAAVIVGVLSLLAMRNLMKSTLARVAKWNGYLSSLGIGTRNSIHKNP